MMSKASLQGYGRHWSVAVLACSWIIVAGCCAKSDTVVLPTTPTGQSSALDDKGAAVVKRFYELLLQKDEPTKKQQDEVFNAAPGIEKRFIITGRSKPGDPIIIKLFRKHKELFLPRNVRPRAANTVAITSTFNVVQKVNRVVTQVPEEGNGYVMALFGEYPTVPGKPKMQNIIFTLTNGKLGYGDIFLDGFSGGTTEQLFLEEAPLTEEQVMKIMREEDKARNKILSDHAVH